jgi:uncharacterized membrane protein YfcA
VSNDFIQTSEYYLIGLLLVVSIVGSYLGKLALQKVKQEDFKKVVLVLILITGIVVLVKSAWTLWA